MVNDLGKAIEFSVKRSSLSTALDELQDRVRSMLIYQHQGGVFVIDQNLVSFTRMLSDDGKGDVTLVDMNGKPVGIPDIGYFHKTIYGRYFEAMNFYRMHYEKLSKDWDSSSIYEFVE